MRQIPIKYLWYSAVLWLAAAVLLTIKSGVYMISAYRDVHWMHIFVYSLTWAFAWWVCSFLILYAVGDVPGKKEWSVRFVLPLVLWALAIASMHELLYLLLDYGVQSLFNLFTGPAFSLADYVSRYFWSGMIESFVLVWVFGGVLYGVLESRAHRQIQAERAALEKELLNARLQTLKSQLQPHFLFNSMQAISSLMHQDVHRAETALAELSDLLRLSLREGNDHKIPLAQEIEFTRKYLGLQQLRFQENLRVEWDIRGDTSALVPAMILQPLVENAVKHGFEPVGKNGEILIRIAGQPDQITIEVRDNGRGAPEIPGIQPGLGLQNTRLRLQYLYRDRFVFQFGNLPEGGFRVLIEIPV